MKDKLREYSSETISVTWSKTRCVHFAACVRLLPDVFDTDQKPWIQPSQASAEAVAEVVTRCPTGALHFARKDGGVEEVPADNTVEVAPKGPLYLHGDVSVRSPSGETILSDTRVALCRCGASRRQPLCDGSHEEAGFRDRGELGNVQLGGEGVKDMGGRLEVSPTPDGPLRLEGPFVLVGADGERERGARAALCRCGASGNKPFCDGTHRSIGFTSDDLLDSADER